MVKYRGIVTQAGEGVVEVLIRPEACNIVCAPKELDKRLCHCATEGSGITVKAIDTLGAKVGDEVIIHQIPRIGLMAILRFLAPLILGSIGYLTLEGASAYIILISGILAGTSILIWEVVHKKAPPPSIVEILRSGDPSRR